MEIELRKFYSDTGAAENLTIMVAQCSWVFVMLCRSTCREGISISLPKYQSQYIRGWIYQG